MVLTSWQDQLYAHLLFSPSDQTCFSSIPRFGLHLSERLRPMHKPKKTAICKQACMAVFSALCARLICGFKL